MKKAYQRIPVDTKSIAVKQDLLTLQQGDRVRVQSKTAFKFDAFEAGMEGVVVENRQDCRNFLVLFDSSSASVTVGYKYLESIGSGSAENIRSPKAGTLPKVAGADCDNVVAHDDVAPPSPANIQPTPPTSAKPSGTVSPTLKRRKSGGMREESEVPKEFVDVEHEPHPSSGSETRQLGKHPLGRAVSCSEMHSGPDSKKIGRAVSWACVEEPERTDGKSKCLFEPERTGVQPDRSDEILKLQLELQQTSSSLRGLKKEHLDLKEELHQKDEVIEMKEDELSQVQSEVDRMQNRLGSQDAELARLREELHFKDMKIGQLDDEMAELRWNMPSESEKEKIDVNVTKEVKTLRSTCGKLQGELILSREMDRKRADEIAHLQRVVQDSEKQMKRLESAQEKELMDAELFIKSLAQTSAHSVLKDRFDLKNMSILGRGCYGYITLCKPRYDKSEKEVVMKWQSERWATVVMKEWAHGSEVGKHPHIVEYIDVFMHADHDGDFKDCLQAGFSSGALQGKQPKKFPGCYFCIAVEYMDRGTVQNLMDQDILTLESIGAITKQISSALAFMHSKQRTHNDIKPENILVRTTQDDKCLLAKLADFGLAKHEVDRKRDCELFGYTIWCMGLQRKFAKVPTGDGQVEALQEFKSGAPNAPKKEAPKDRKALNRTQSTAAFHQSANQSIDSRMLWTDLYGVIHGMWGLTLDMHEIEDIETFEMLTVKVPEKANKDLEEAAKNDLHKRSVRRTTVFQKLVTRSCPTLPEISQLVDESKKYDSNYSRSGYGADESSDSQYTGSETEQDPSDRRSQAHKREESKDRHDPSHGTVCSDKFTTNGSTEVDWSNASKNVASNPSAVSKDRFVSNGSTSSGSHFKRSKTVSHCMGEDKGLLSPNPSFSKSPAGSPNPSFSKSEKKPSPRARRNSAPHALSLDGSAQPQPQASPNGKRQLKRRNSSNMTKADKHAVSTEKNVARIARPTWPAPDQRKHSVERIRGVLLTKDVDDDPSSPINEAAIGLVGADPGDLGDWGIGSDFAPGK